MKTIEVEVYGEAVNSPVLKLPGRSYPGVLLQGDSLFILYCDALAIVEKLEKVLPERSIEDDQEDTAMDLAEYLVWSLRGYLQNYQWAHQQQGLPLPYPRETFPVED